MTLLIDVAAYQLFTGDLTPSSAAVTGAITLAAQEVDEHCHRHFAYGTYTETLPVTATGRVYPKATPLAVVTAPSGATVDGVAVLVGGGTWSLSDTWPGVVQRTQAISYSGGYTPYGTVAGAAPALPAKVAQAIARVAYNVLHPVVLAGVPSGATSASVGDVAVSTSGGRELSGLSDHVDAAAAKLLFGYVKRPRLTL